MVFMLTVAVGSLIADKDGLIVKILCMGYFEPSV